MGKTKERIRLIVLALLVLAVFLTGTFRLMQFQIVKGADFLEESNSRIVSRTTINAARGEIVDRYGRSLATNKVGFNIVFDRAFMTKGEENSIISDLIDLLQKSGVEWIDECPITKTEPYAFIPGMENEISKMKKREYLNLNTYATAQNCLDELVKKFDIRGYDKEKTRLIAGVRYQMMISDFSVYNRYTFAEDIPASLVSIIKEFSYNLPGVDISEETMRNYVSGKIAPHIIGTIGPIYAEQYSTLKEKGYKMNDIIGKSGVELSFEEYLRGTDGVREIAQNKKGVVVTDTITKQPVPGNTVMLTIDKYFQEEVQNILEDHILRIEKPSKSNDQKAFAGAAVVLDVKTGEVLACATYPSYDINDYRTKYSELRADQKGLPLLNRPLQGLYRPGSTFKTTVAIGGLSEGLVNANTTFNCNGVWNHFKGWPMKCLGIGHRGNTNIFTAVQKSCNVYFYETGLKLGIDNLGKYANALGLGTKTGLEISSSTGAISSPDRFKQLGGDWNPGEVAQTAIGQSETVVTPLQMATQAMTLANNGTRYETHIIKSIQSYNFDKTIEETKPVVAHQLPNTNGAFDTVRKGMIAGGNDVPAIRALPYDVAVKTGTPQKNKSITNSAAIAYGPADNPEISISIYIEEGNNAKAMISRILEAYENTKNMQQEYPQNSQTLLP